MNIKDYISSGIIETYALGAASEQEAREFELMCLQYPEVQHAFDEYQKTLEEYATQYAVTPPKGLKQNIWQAIQAEANSIPVSSTTIPVQHKEQFASSSANTVPKKSIALWKYTAAASIALLIASGIYNISLVHTNKETAAALTTLQQQQQENLAHQQKNNEALSILLKPTTKTVTLDGVGAHLKTKAMLYWDSVTGDVFLNLNDMPQAPEGKQYQLWAIVDGKPVDAGMYNPTPGTPMYKMKSIARAEMFAITIEQKGGSANPTMDQMVVAGKPI